MILIERTEMLVSETNGKADTAKAKDQSVPRHVAIIMDGNRRWAKAHRLPVALGHYRGAEAARKAIEAALDLGVSCLTLFGFSSENWKRPEDEVNEIMVLLRRYLRQEIGPLHKANIKLRVIGGRERFSSELIDEIEEAESRTAKNTGLLLAIAFSYGGRDDIVRAARRIAEDVAKGRIDPGQISEKSFCPYLQTSFMPDPDLVIRTSGEKRISNFLLWQSAYAEFIFIEKFWPDFGKDDFRQAVTEYTARDRRYGAIR